MSIVRGITWRDYDVSARVVEVALEDGIITHNMRSELTEAEAKAYSACLLAAAFEADSLRALAEFDPDVEQ